jgi:hypothetical protein
MTVVTADHFMHYIPLFVLAARTWADRVDMRFYVRGDLDTITMRAMTFAAVNGVSIIPNYGPGFPYTVSATNTLRFILGDNELKSYDYVLITDVDLLLFQNPFPYHIEQIERTQQPFAGHHGPYHKPHRPEIAQAWQGPFERVAGGFFCVTPEWYEKTGPARAEQSRELLEGRIGHYRESDEVSLARIIKASGCEVPLNKHFPASLRGVHLGDAKDSMLHRIGNFGKMLGILTNENCYAFMALQNTDDWVAAREILSGDVALCTEIDRMNGHIYERGIR